MKRRTQQRQAIRRALETADRPLGPQEIHAAAEALAPGLGIATVYRNIQALLDDGFVRSVELPGAPPRYEVSGKSHHHHFHCRECDGVFEVDDCPDGVRGMTPAGFELETHEIVLYGLCAGCADPP